MVLPSIELMNEISYESVISEIFDIITNSSVDSLPPTLHGLPPLHWAAIADNVPLIELLVAGGQSVNVCTTVDYPFTPTGPLVRVRPPITLPVQSRWRRSVTFDSCRDHHYRTLDIDISALPAGATPLHAACAAAAPAAALALLALGADAAPPSAPLTPLTICGLRAAAVSAACSLSDGGREAGVSPRLRAAPAAAGHLLCATHLLAAAPAAAPTVVDLLAVVSAGWGWAAERLAYLSTTEIVVTPWGAETLMHAAARGGLTRLCAALLSTTPPASTPGYAPSGFISGATTPAAGTGAGSTSTSSCGRNSGGVITRAELELRLAEHAEVALEGAGGGVLDPYSEQGLVYAVGGFPADSGVANPTGLPAATLTPVCLAITFGRDATALALLRAAPSVPRPSALLALAAACGRSELVHPLVREFCADANACTLGSLTQHDPTMAAARADFARPPLHLAAGRGFVYTCRVLLAAGANVEAPDAKGRTALYHALANGAANAALFLTLRAPPCTPAGWTTVLCPSVRGGLTGWAAAALAGGADAGAQDVGARVRGAAQAGDHLAVSEQGGDETWCALHYAAENGDLHLLQTLLLAGADPNGCPGQTTSPLSVAAAANDTLCVTLLLDAGAAVDGHLDTRPPLAQAVRAGAGAAVRLLLDAGAEPNGRGMVFTMMHDHIGRTGVDADYSIFDSLVAAGASPDTHAPGTPVPLRHAITTLFVPLARRLVAAGATVDAGVLQHLLAAWPRMLRTPGAAELLGDVAARAPLAGALVRAAMLGPAPVHVLLEAGADVGELDGKVLRPLVARLVKEWKEWKTQVKS